MQAYFWWCVTNNVFFLFAHDASQNPTRALQASNMIRTPVQHSTLFFTCFIQMVQVTRRVPAGTRNRAGLCFHLPQSGTKYQWIQLLERNFFRNTNTNKVILSRDTQVSWWSKLSTPQFLSLLNVSLKLGKHGRHYLNCLYIFTNRFVWWSFK